MPSSTRDGQPFRCSGALNGTSNLAGKSTLRRAALEAGTLPCSTALPCSAASRSTALLCASALLLVACSKAPGYGATAQLQVSGATYAAGALTGGNAGPAVISTYARNSSITPGHQEVLLDGTLGPGATAVLLGLPGDPGYWILPASPPDIETPDQPTFSASLGFAASIVSPQLQITVVAVDLAGQRGPASSVAFTVLRVAPPEVGLVVELDWDSEADLDLHVVDPFGNELWAGNLTTPAEPNADAGTSPGTFGFDSNANCVIDGLRAETATWAAPPPGTYVVRVDDFSLCRATVAHWNVYVLRDGVVRLQAQGVATPADSRFVKGPGGGIQALSFAWQ